MLGTWNVTEPLGAVLHREDSDDICIYPIDDPVWCDNHFADIVRADFRHNATGRWELFEPFYDSNDPGHQPPCTDWTVPRNVAVDIV